MNRIKVHSALVRIKEAIDLYGTMTFLGHSGGKDSCVIHHLTKQFYPNITLVHNVKPMLKDVRDDPIAKLTAMHPSTLEFLYSEVASKHKIHFMPAAMMDTFVKSNDFKCQIDGARISEANRPGKSSNFIQNGQNVNRKELKPFVENGMFGLHVCYPIYDWTDDDVFDYIVDSQLHLSDEYLDNGEIMDYLARRQNAEK